MENKKNKEIPPRENENSTPKWQNARAKLKYVGVFNKMYSDVKDTSQSVIEFQSRKNIIPILLSRIFDQKKAKSEISIFLLKRL